MTRNLRLRIPTIMHGTLSEVAAATRQTISQAADDIIRRDPLYQISELCERERLRFALRWSRGEYIGELARGTHVLYTARAGALDDVACDLLDLAEAHSLDLKRAAEAAEND